MATTLIYIIFVLIIQVQCEIDPCITNSPDVTIVPHDPEFATRSANVTSNQGNLLCDRTLQIGWYIFEAPTGPRTNVVPSLKLPTRCIQNYHCGTKYPVWMRGDIPASPEDGIVTRDACVSVGTSCCSFRLGIKVKNCGNERYAYYLRPSPGCPAAYCFGEHMPCPAGEGSETGFTPGCVSAEVNELTEDPVLILENDDDPLLTTIQYACRLSLPAPVDPQIKLDIQWLVNNQEIDRLTSEEVKAGDNIYVLPEYKLIYVTNPGDLFETQKPHFGKELSCRTRAFFIRGAYSSWRESRRKFLGIEILNPRNIVLDEGDIYNIQLKFHTPYTGDDPLDIEVGVPEGADGRLCATDATLPQLVTGSCKHQIPPGTWKDVQNITIKATTDNKIETRTRALRRIALKTSNVVFSHIVWSNYRLPAIEIAVQDKDTELATCQSTNDPHMRTFDGVYYENQNEGHFILYRHKTYPFEVHAYYKRCGSGATPVCNCAVGILSVDDVIIFDKCGRGVIDVTSWNGENRLRMAQRGGCQQRGTRILRENGGRKYTVTLPSGTSVIVEDSYHTFINLYITSSFMDLEQTEGLCGLFDKNCANDLIAREAVVQDSSYSRHCGHSNPRRPQIFSLSWKIPEDQSILHWNSRAFLDDQRLTTYDGHVYCSCPPPDADHDDAWVLECRPGGDAPNCPPRARARDITQNKLGACRRKRDLEYYDHVDFLDYDETEYNIVAQPAEEDVRKKRSYLQTDFSSPYLQTPNTSPYLQGTFNSPYLQIRRKRKTTYTEESARAFCQYFVFNSTAAERCSELPNIDFSSPVEACVLDLMATGDPNWAIAALDTVKQQCLSELDRNTTLWIAPDPESNITVPPPEILGSICYNECSGRGSCQNGTCICTTGFMGPDCSIDLSVPPDVYFTPKCDMHRKPCQSNPVIGNNFVENVNLTCHLEKIKITENGYLSSGTKSTEQASFESYGEVICPTPHSRPRRDISTETDGYLISVSNNGELRSRSVLYIIYDSLCQACNVSTGICIRREDSCNISGICYGSGDLNPSDSCRVCNPVADQNNWSSSNATECLPLTIPLPANTESSTSVVTSTSPHAVPTTQTQATSTIGGKPIANGVLQDWEIALIACGAGLLLVLLISVIAVVIVMVKGKRTFSGTYQVEMDTH